MYPLSLSVPKATFIWPFSPIATPEAILSSW
ncbi:Uncharacterised protein [Vibrio cholerae]|nr:Uncharacterised protein [Vibrio cholerae]CSI50042.1 Uncharacterised protein [Vibrio cholerae]